MPDPCFPAPALPFSWGGGMPALELRGRSGDLPESGHEQPPQCRILECICLRGGTTRNKLLLPCVSFSVVCRSKEEKQPAAGHRLDRGRLDLEEALP